MQVTILDWLEMANLKTTCNEVNVYWKELQITVEQKGINPRGCKRVHRTTYL